jgi:hypothetical protein
MPKLEFVAVRFKKQALSLLPRRCQRNSLCSWYIERYAAIQGKSSVQLESADDLVDPAGYAGADELISAERQIIVSSKDEGLAAVVVAVPRPILGPIRN